MPSAILVPPRTPDDHLGAAAEDDNEDVNEQDLTEAFEIADGTSPLLPERRHLIALAKAWGEACDLAAVGLGAAEHFAIAINAKKTAPGGR